MALSFYEFACNLEELQSNTSILLPLFPKTKLLQLSTTISMAYIVFYISEGIFETSGVLATVSMGMVFSECSRGIIVSKAVLDVGWDTFGFIGNTLIFSIAGCICGKISLLDSTLQYVSYSDVKWIFVSWIASFVTRCAMLIILYPLLKLARIYESKATTSKSNDCKDSLIIAWGGLRGAVSLALAITVYNQNLGSEFERDGTLLILHVMGVAGLTLLVNAATASHLLNVIGMTEMQNSHKLVVRNFGHKVEAEVCDYANSLVAQHNDRKNEFDECDACTDDIAEFVTILRERKQENQGSPVENHNHSARNEIMSMKSNLVESSSKKMETRELLLKLVRAEYNEMIDYRSIVLPPERHEASRNLLNSTLTAMDDLSHLGDFDYLEKCIEANPMYIFIYDICDRIHAPKSGSRKLNYLHEKRETAYALLLAFEKAHVKAQSNLLQYFSDIDPSIRSVVEESKRNLELAKSMREHMDKKLKKSISLSHLARKVLMFERQQIMSLVENGVLLKTDEEVLLHENEEDFLALKKRGNKLAAELTKRAIRRSSEGKARDVANDRSITIHIGKDEVGKSWKKEKFIIKTLYSEDNKDIEMIGASELSLLTMKKTEEAAMKREVTVDYPVNEGRRKSKEHVHFHDGSRQEM